jgi:hypothetical protein
VVKSSFTCRAVLNAYHVIRYFKDIGVEHNSGTTYEFLCRKSIYQNGECFPPSRPASHNALIIIAYHKKVSPFAGKHTATRQIGRRWYPEIRPHE